MAVGRCNHQATNPFDSSDSENSYTNPFDDEVDGHEETSIRRSSSSSVLRNAERGKRARRYDDLEDGEELVEVKVERKLPFSQRLMPWSSEEYGIATEHHNTTLPNDGSSCGRQCDDEELDTFSFSRRRSVPTRDRDLVSMAGLDSSSGHRGDLLKGGSSQSAAQFDENHAIQDLRMYAQEKPKETVETVRNCLRVVEETKEAAGRTIEMLHCQGDQIQRTHENAVKLDRHLSVGEKILGSLGGMFSMKWKPRIARTVSGPLHCSEDSQYMPNHADRTALGLQGDSMRTRDEQRQPLLEEDEALTDLSNVLGHLKDLSLQMNSEISKQTEGLTYLQDDVQELNDRVKGANVRGGRLLRRR